MKNNSLELSIEDCERIEEEFTKKAVMFSNFFTDTDLKAESAKQVISRLDSNNKIRLVYGEEARTEPKKSDWLKRTVITALAATALLGTAYFSALAYFEKQGYEARIQGLTAEKSFVLLQKQKSDKNNRAQQESITALQTDYASALKTVSTTEKKYGCLFEEKTKLQQEYLRKIGQHQECLQSMEQENEQIEEKNSSLKKENTDLAGRIWELSAENTSIKTEASDLKSKHSAEIEQLIEAQIIQRTQKYGDYRRQGTTFSEFSESYAEFFFGKKPSNDEKEVIDRILRKCVKTDGQAIDDVIQSWKCSTIVLLYQDGLRVIDP